ncbi:MAG: RNA-binding protein [Thermodesulfobacteriota bacterium]|nr:RNA-binding protein [Thermodesulfobacteriota bacterium]
MITGFLDDTPAYPAYRQAGAGRDLKIRDSRLFQKSHFKRRETMNIYVGNLSFDVSEENLQTAFSAYGQVSSATIVKDKYSGQARGFGFVEMPDSNEARTAIANLNGKELNGRQMNVNEARPRADRGGSGGRGGGRGGRSNFGGRGRY